MRFLFLAILLSLIQAVVWAQQDTLSSVRETDYKTTIERDTFQSIAIDTTQTVQIDTVIPNNNPLRFKPSVKREKTIDTVTIRDYKVISYARDTTYLDTTLTIQKEYEHNYLRKDDFELMPFANVGQPYNILGKIFSQNPYYPRIGATARHYTYLETEDIPYYSVPTPMTEIMYKSVLEEGQLLDALMTFNFSRRFNASIAYRGFRSLGKYQFEQALSGNFSTTLSYSTRDHRYSLRTHIAAQNIEAQENGGLLDRSQFESNIEDFKDRSRIDVRYTDANSKLEGTRYFLDQQLALISQGKDTLDRPTNPLTLGHELIYETKLYQFTQDAQNNAFGQDPFETPIRDRAQLKTLSNSLYTEYASPTLGKIRGRANLYHYDYFFKDISIAEQMTLSDRLQGEEIVIGGDYTKTIGRFSIASQINHTLSGDLTDHNFNTQINYRVNDRFALRSAFHLSARMPDFNYLFYQSDYRNFNWHNIDIFKKQRIQNFRFALDSQKLGILEAAYSLIDNYTYFKSIASPQEIALGQETAFVKPFQENNTIKHLRIKYTKELNWRKWTLRNTALYQYVAQDNQVLNLPQKVGRHTLYFSSHVFKRAMFLQTGITLKYFTPYAMNAYNPLLGEFFVQNNEEFGGYPLFDIFINAKVKRTRIFLKGEHINAIFATPNYFAAPNYPYRDFVIRFGFVWNFFS